MRDDLTPEDNLSLLGSISLFPFNMRVNGPNRHKQYFIYFYVESELGTGEDHLKQNGTRDCVRWWQLLLNLIRLSFLNSQELLRASL